MHRIVSIAIFSFALCGICFAQPLSNIEEPMDPSLRLTHEDLNSGTAPYPFESSLNECIREDILKHEIGSSCVSEFFKFCPESEPGEFLHARMRCSGFGTRYWQTRLDDALGELMRVYDEQDHALLGRTHRALIAQDINQKWAAWRDASCEFEQLKNPHFLGRAFLDVTLCEYRLTANRALEVEYLIRVTNY